MDPAIQKGLNSLQPLYSRAAATDDSLFGGNLGLVLLYSEWYRQTGQLKYLRKTEEVLTGIFYRLNQDSPGLAGPSLSRGGAGLAIVLQLLEPLGLLTVPAAGAMKDLDRYLFQAANYQLDHDITDCLHGAFGIIHYFNRHPPGTPGNNYLNKLVHKACKRAIKSPAGYWFRNNMLQERQQDEINFSLSHGLSGMLLILLEAFPNTIHQALTEEVIKMGIRFIRRHQLYVDSGNGEYSFFPLSVREHATEIENRPRMGWCYGDLNQALLFYRAGKLFGDRTLTALGDIVGMHSLMRKDEMSTQVTDSHFCHGAAGLAQFYHSLYTESLLAPYQQGYQYWISKTMEYLQKDLELKNFQNKEHSLLEGPVGVSLVLLSSCKQTPADWARLLLL